MVSDVFIARVFFESRTNNYAICFVYKKSIMSLGRAIMVSFYLKQEYSVSLGRVNMISVLFIARVFCESWTSKYDICFIYSKSIL